MQADPDEYLVDVSYFTTHEFHKLAKKTNKKNKNFSILHSNICSLQGNFDKLQLLSKNLDYKLNIIVVTETCHIQNSIHFSLGRLDGDHKYE